ncbi:MAG: serine/threonine protein kinase [Gemmatimonadetes bacterium]|nr:serine/threonine protein kinase [Gemmatimonadota bacterium]
MAEEASGPGNTDPGGHDFGKIGKYDLEDLVGEGAMGKVYRAMDPVLSRHVAIKLMSASISQDTHLRDRFLREVRAAANLQHPNIITIYDFGDSSGHPYIAMEYVEGTDLARIIQDRQPMSLESKVTYVINLLEGLAYAHTKGVVHRDIKPANIRITADGRVKIMDFGIAHLQGSEMTHSGVVLGTPDYMAPEQVRGLPVTPQTDIWAAGAVLYELLTYEKPFSGETLHAVLFKVVTEEPTAITKLNPSLPEALERIVNTALNKDAGKRYSAADAMAADLSSVRKHLGELETKATLRFSRPLMALELPMWERLTRSLVWKRVSGAVAPAMGRAMVLARKVPIPARYKTRNMAVAAGGVAFMGVAALTLSLLGRKPEPEAPEVSIRPIVVTDTTPQAVAVVDSAPPPPASKKALAVAQRTPPKRPPTTTPGKAQQQTPPPPAETGDARAAVKPAVDELEKVFDSRKVARLKKLLPTMADSNVKKWDAFFKQANKLDTNFDLRRVKIDGDNATVALTAHFVYNSASGKQVKWDPDLSGTLVKQGTAWVWKGLTGR